MATLKKSLSKKEMLPNEVRRFLLDGSRSGEAIVLTESEERSAWKEHGAELVEEHVKRSPGTRPAGWWTFDAPGPRLRVGGKGEARFPKSLRLGIPTYFWDARFYGAMKIAVPDARPRELIDAGDPPSYESQAMFLRRNDLLSPGEESKLSEDDFRPETVKVPYRN